ncbi:uncharacterized protein DS421_18g622020 [Arachis hypogaea]|nr:uncharacterized protein DS421_18g622020 [Arachis hypogaea]
MFPGSSLRFWGGNWVKTRPKIAPSIFCYFCRSHMSRIRVSHAYASLVVLACHAYASVTCTRLCADSNPRVRVRHAHASMQISPYRALA